jgi:hypothetical protein
MIHHRVMEMASDVLHEIHMHQTMVGAGQQGCVSVPLW